MATTAQTIISGAFDLCNLTAPGESLSATDNTDALRRLNNFVKILNNQSLISAFIAREVWPLTANKGTYTIGPGGDFDTIRPLDLEGVAILQNPTIGSFAVTAVSTANGTFSVAGDQTGSFVSGAEFALSGSTGNDGNYTVVSSVFGVATVITVIEAVMSSTADGTIQVFTSGTSTIEIPRTLYTDAAYQNIRVKSLTNSLPTGVYFNADFGRGLASLVLWPIPNVATNALVLYRRNLLPTFADLATTSYEVPNGFEELLEYGLARRLMTPYAVSDPQVRADIVEGFRNAMMIVKRSNYKPTDMPIDAVWTHDRRGYYNIQTGNY